MNQIEDFVKIEPEYFLKGMYVDTDVFYIQENRPVLFCKQTVITDDKIARLQKIADNNAPIFLSKQGYERLMEQYRRFHNHSLEHAKTYNKVKAEFAKLYEAGRGRGQIEMNDAERLADLVNGSMDSVEFSFILQWISYMRGADEYLYTHSVNVAILNGLMGKWLGMPVEESKNLVMTGLLHDIGKIRIDEEVLNKPGRLTEDEFESIKQHPLHSYRILKESGVTDENILRGVRGHHEKGNGGGYPDGLILEDISYYAKITAISDIYDAMVAKRIYKEAKTPFEVLDEFYRDKFSNLDIRLVDIFLDKMATEMTGRDVVISDGRIAHIVFVEKSNFAYPIVQYRDEVIHTSRELRCVSLCSQIC